MVADATYAALTVAELPLDGLPRETSAMRFMETPCGTAAQLQC
jgi:hypothetical protein